MTILVVGSAHLDIIAQPVSSSEHKKRDGHVSFGVGGAGWNVAHGFRRIGLSVRLLTAWSEAPVSRMIASHIVSSGVELLADEVPGMALAASVVQTSVDGKLQSGISATPIGDYNFETKRIAQAMSGVDCIVLDANLSQSTIKTIAQRAKRRNTPVFALGVSEEKVDRLLSASGLLAGAFMNHAECERLMLTLGAADAGEVAEALAAPVVVTRGERGAVGYLVDGQRIRYGPAQIGSVINLLGVGDAYAVEIIDALLRHGMDFVESGRHTHGLVAEVAASAATNAYSVNALNSMVGGLQDDARNDPLTALLRRPAFEEQYHRLKGGRNTVVLLDCDHFKSVNDRFGHEAGDHVLRTVAEIISASLRGTDVPCRWGGDEFVLLLPRTDEDEASVVAERIRERAASAELHGVTLSIGLTLAGRDEPLEEVVRRADDAMYAAKRGGKNALVWAYAAA